MLDLSLTLVAAAVAVFDITKLEAVLHNWQIPALRHLNIKLIVLGSGKLTSVSPLTGPRVMSLYARAAVRTNLRESHTGTHPKSGCHSIWKGFRATSRDLSGWALQVVWDIMKVTGLLKT